VLPSLKNKTGKPINSVRCQTVLSSNGNKEYNKWWQLMTLESIQHSDS